MQWTPRKLARTCSWCCAAALADDVEFLELVVGDGLDVTLAAIDDVEALS